MIQTDSVQDETGFLLAKVCKAHRGNVGELLSEVGLHVGQEMVLIELWRRDGLRGGELAERLRVEPPTVTRMVRRLESCGLLERRQDPRDARSFRAYLTDAGRALEEPVTRCWEQAEEKILAGMSKEDRTELRRLLTRLRDNLETE